MVRSMNNIFFNLKINIKSHNKKVIVLTYFIVIANFINYLIDSILPIPYIYDS